MLHRVLRRPDHHALPNFIGSKFPREDDADDRDMYCASMLMLLKPWRDLASDLKGTDETWEAAFNEFRRAASTKELNILSSIQYFHECERAARDTPSSDSTNAAASDIAEVEEDVPDPDEFLRLSTKKHPITSDGISLREDAHARLAVEKAKHSKVFDEDERGWDVSNGAKARLGSGDDIQRLEKWKAQMADDVLSLNQVANTGTLQSATNDGQGQTDLLANREDGARVIALERQEAPLQREEEHPAEKTEQTLTAIDSSMLKDDQYRAYDIITWHLEQVLAGAKPPLLRQILHGEGGTGKSKVIQTVTQHSPARCKIHAYQSSLHGNSSLDH